MKWLTGRSAVSNRIFSWNRQFHRALLIISGMLAVATGANAQQVGVFTVAPQTSWSGYAVCTDQNGYIVPYCFVSLYNGYYIYTGGHLHDDFSHADPSYGYFGRLSVTGGNTGSTGLPLTFYASRTGEREWIDSCAAYCNTTDAIVRNTDLQQLYAGYNFTLIGDKPWHPSNHWALQSTITSILAVMQWYSENYHTELRLPDSGS